MAKPENYINLGRPQNMAGVLAECERMLSEGVKDPKNTAIGGEFDGRYLFPGLSSEFAVAEAFAPVECLRAKPGSGYDLLVRDPRKDLRVEIKSVTGFGGTPDPDDHVFIDYSKVWGARGLDVIGWDYILFTRTNFRKLYDYQRDGRPLISLREEWEFIRTKQGIEEQWNRQAAELQGVLVLGLLTADRFRELIAAGPSGGVIRLKEGEYGMRSQGKTKPARGDSYHVPINLLDPA